MDIRKNRTKHDDKKKAELWQTETSMCLRQLKCFL